MIYQTPTISIRWCLFRGVEISGPKGMNNRKNYDLFEKDRCWLWPEVACALGWIPEHVPLELQIREARLYLKRITKSEPRVLQDPGWFAAPGPTEAAYRTDLDRIRKRLNIPRLKTLVKKGQAKT